MRLTLPHISATADPSKLPYGTPLALYLVKYMTAQLPTLTRHGGSLYAEISGKDCIGFLYGMLRMFSFYSLFPTELEISTKGMVVHDRFWLKGIGSAAPSDDDLKALHERLHQTFGDGLKKATPRSSVMEVDTSRYLH